MGSSARGRLIDTDQVGQRAMEDETVRNRIRAEIARNDVVLLMKGTPQIPQCGFSAIRQGRQEVFQLADHSKALCEAGIRRRLRHRARDVIKAANSRSSCKTRA
jgi:hypothetical protein